VSDAVLLPVYNEESTVDAVLDAVRRYFDGEVIVVDDGSDDETPRVLAARDDITVVHLDRNCGYGCALKIGFRIAHDIGVTRLITMDCDGQHEPAHIPQFLTAMAEGGDIISGSRYLPGSARVGVAPESRQAINQRITAEINGVTGWGLTDAFCGFKAYRLPALDCIRLEEPGYAMPLELWAKAWKCGLEVREIPVERIYCDHERSFGVELDDPETRFAYYVEVWERALKGDS
jgi:dolichol-phosphate mannosyltransferase